MKRTSISVVVLVLVVGCKQSNPRERGPVELETVDVDAGFDAELSTDSDKRARHMSNDVGGVLPSDVPEGLPIFSPSSVVDFGPGFVELDTPVPETEVRSSLASSLQRAGWSVDAVGEEGGLYSRGGDRVRIRLSEIGSGTRIRYEY